MKKRVITIALIISILFIFLVFWYRDIIFNLSEIKEIKNCDKLYITYKEHSLSEDVAYDKPLIFVKFMEIEFQHPFGNLKHNSLSDEHFFSTKNDSDIIFNIIPEEIGVVFKVGDDVIPNRAKRCIANVYGEDVLSNDFALLKKAFEVTPDNLSLLKTPKNILVANYWLLRIKLINQPAVNFVFESDSTQGFQQGLPGDKERVRIIAFDTSGRAKNNYYIIISGSFTQEEVDIILNSLKFVNE